MNVISPTPRRIQSLSQVKQSGASIAGSLGSTTAISSPPSKSKTEKVKVQTTSEPNKTKQEQSQNFHEFYVNSLARYLDLALSRRPECSFRYDGLVFAIQVSVKSKSFSICAGILKCPSANASSVMRHALEWNCLNHRERQGCALALAPNASEEPEGQLKFTLCYTQTMAADERMQAGRFMLLSRFVETASRVRRQLNRHCKQIIMLAGTPNRKSTNPPTSSAEEKTLPPPVPPLLTKKAALHPARKQQQEEDQSLSLASSSSPTITTTQTDKEHSGYLGRTMNQSKTPLHENTAQMMPALQKPGASASSTRGGDMATRDNKSPSPYVKGEEKTPRPVALTQSSLSLWLAQTAAKSWKSSKGLGKVSPPLDTSRPTTSTSSSTIYQKQSIDGTNLSGVPLRFVAPSTPPTNKEGDRILVQNESSVSSKRCAPSLVERAPPLPPPTDINKTPTISNKRVDRPPPQSFIKKATKRLSMQRNYLTTKSLL